MNIDAIIDDLAVGKIGAEEVLALLVAAGMTEEEAVYNIRSMDTVDVLRAR